MATAENVEAPDVEERDQDVYPPRSEEDLESVVEELEEVEDEEVEQAVRQVSELADDNLRTGQNSVGIHANAPIRSLNNPEENQVEMSDGSQGQVLGEEYFVGQNLPGFQDVGNIKWWTLMEDGSYREETRGGGREHLQLNNEGDIDGYRIELDGEVLEGEQVQRLARNLRIRSEANTSVTEENIIPENIIEHSTREELLENTELSESEYVEQIEEAQEYGLITEEGELTLKGWVTGADMQAQDLRGLEEISNGADTAQFGRLHSEEMPGADSDNLVGHDATLTASTHRSLESFIVDGRVEDEELDDELSELLQRINRVAEFDIEDKGEEQTETYTTGIREFYDGVMGWEVPKEDIVGNMSRGQAAELARAAKRDDNNNLEVSFQDAELYTSQNGNAADRDLQLNDLSEYLGCSEEDLEREMKENLDFNIEEGSLEIEYDGDNEKLSDMLYNLDPWLIGSLEDDRPEGSFTSEKVLNTSYLELLEFEDELNTSEFNRRYGKIGRIREYTEKSEELKSKVEELEEDGIIETELTETLNPTADVRIAAEDPLEYREALREIDELSYLNFPKSTDSWREHVKTDLENVKASFNVTTDDREKLKEMLGDMEGEFRDLVEDEDDMFLGESVVEVKEYRKGIPGPKDLINFAVDYVDSEYLEEAVRKVVDEPEMVEKTVFGERGLTDQHKTIDEYGVGDNERPSERILEKLGELYDAGLIDAERRIYNRREDYETREEEFTDYTETARVDYGELDSEQKEELRRLEEQGLITLDEPEKDLEITSQGDRNENGISIELQGEYSIHDIDIEGEMEFDVEYEPGDNFIYQASDDMRRVAEQLDPLNFNSDPYEDVTVENDFNYGEEISATQNLFLNT
jgi:uncharacterized protein (UPF0147 family)